MEGLKEYILREDAVAAVMNTDPHVFLTYNKKEEKTDIVVAQITEEVLEEINKIPAADVVPVVRCAECKYQDKGENDCEAWNLCGYRPWLHIPTEDDAFCSKGERKDG